MSAALQFPEWTKEAVEARFRTYLGDPKDESREAKKRRTILMAGYQRFLRQGYKKTSIDEVAKDARVAKGTVYLYFRSKSDLLMHCIAFEKQAVRGVVDAMFAPETPDRERLRHWLRASLWAIRDMPLSSRLMTGDMEMWDALADAPPEMAAMRDEGKQILLRLIELAAPGRFSDAEKSARADVLQSFAFVSPSYLDVRTRGGRDVTSFLDSLIDVILHGIVGRERK